MPAKTAKQPDRFSARKRARIATTKRRPAASLKNLGIEASNFCGEQGLMTYLQKAIVELDRHFKLNGPPGVHLVTDPETDESYLRISACVEGSVNDVAGAYNRYIAAWCVVAPRDVAGAIRLSLTIA